MKFFLLHSILMSILLMNLTAKEAQLLDDLHTKVSTLKKIKAKDPETFKTWLSKKDKKKQQQLKLAIVYSNKIKELRAKKEGASEQKKAKIDQKIDKTIAKAKARGIEVVNEDREDNIPRKQFMEKSLIGLDSISERLAELSSKYAYSIDLAAFKNDLINMKMETPFGDLLKADLQDRTGSLEEEKVIKLKEKIAEMVDQFHDKKSRLSHYQLNQSHFYSVKDLKYTALNRDLNEFVKLVDRCGEAPIINDMRYISTTDDHKIKEKIKAAFVEWKKDIANVYATAKFPKGTMVSSFKIKTELEKVFKQEDNSLIKQLYDSIEGSFNGQLELLANDAKTQVFTIINSYVNNDKYIQSLKDNGHHTISFKDYNAVGAALVNAKAEGSGDIVVDSTLQEFFDEWKRVAIASLAPVEGDTQSFVDMYTLDAVGKGLASKSHESFNDFWNRVNAIFTGVDSSPTAITVKNSIEEEVNALKSSDFFQKLPPTGKFPDVRTLAAYITDVTMDTTFKSYQNKWETWRKKNLISTIGIPQDTDFYPERLKMLIGDLFNFRYACNETIAGFASECFNTEIDLLKSTLKKGEDDKFTSAEVQIAWNKFVLDLSPTTAHWNNIKRHLEGKALYDYIQTYTEMLPTAIELQEALADSRVTVATSGGRSYITGLKGKFEWGDWSVFDLLPIKRGFELRLKVKMIESGGMQRVKSISAKITNEHGVALDAKQFKFKIGKAEQNDTLLTQPITVQLKVLSFRNSSTGGGISKTIGVSYSESVPIGSAEYSVECEFEQYGTVASFRSLNAGTATNLPQLKLSFPAQIQLKKK